jgi:hypothetical protein
MQELAGLGGLSVGVDPFSVSVGDFNGDDNLDLAITDYYGNSVDILLVV